MNAKSVNTNILCLLYFTISFSTAAFGEVRLNDVNIPMRDGKSLAANVILPNGKDKFPAIYIHTPYKKENASNPLPGQPFRVELLDKENYAYVITDWRGYFGLKEAGEGIKIPDHGKDGYDAIEWIAKQPWSNGKIGMWGHSAAGGVQYKIAALHPPHLVCIAPSSGYAQTQYELYYEGGVYQKHYSDVITALGQNKFNKMSLILQHPTKDWFWKLFGDDEVKQTAIDLPILFETGWYDSHAGIKIDMFNKVRTPNKKYYYDMKCLIGPWHHGAFGMAEQGILSYPEAAGVTAERTKQFFDYYLRDKKNSLWTREPPYYYFMMGRNKWYGSLTWPPKTVKRIYYLASGNKLNDNKSGEEDPDIFISDPTKPVPTVGGSNVVLKTSKIPVLNALDAGPQDLAAQVENRGDVIIYTTDVLTSDLDVIGNPAMNLFVSSDCLDTDIAVRLSDVYPDGRSIIIADGIQRMKFRNSLSKPVLMTPNKIYEISFPLSITGQTFLAGHKIRISISSTNYPKYAVNPNTSRNFGVQNLNRKAANKIYHDNIHPSGIILPIRNIN